MEIICIALILALVIQIIFIYLILRRVLPYIKGKDLYEAESVLKAPIFMKKEKKGERLEDRVDMNSANSETWNKARESME